MATFKVFFSDYSTMTVETLGSNEARKVAATEAERRGAFVRKVKRVRC